MARRFTISRKAAATRFYFSTESDLLVSVAEYHAPSARPRTLYCDGPDRNGEVRQAGPEYAFFDHVKYVEGFIEKLGLQRITLVIHDWGSALGFHYAMRNEANIKALAFMEALIMPVPSWDVFPQDLGQTFQAFRTPEVGWDMIVKNHMFVEQVLPGAIVRTLTEAEMDYYRAPYTDPGEPQAALALANEIPIAGEPGQCGGRGGGV